MTAAAAAAAVVAAASANTGMSTYVSEEGDNFRYHRCNLTTIPLTLSLPILQ